MDITIDFNTLVDKKNIFSWIKYQRHENPKINKYVLLGEWKWWDASNKIK